MRYSDTELYKLSKDELDSIKLTMVVNDYYLWSISRLSELILESTQQDNWLEPDVAHLRNYRTKARDKYFAKKLVRKEK